MNKGSEEIRRVPEQWWLLQVPHVRCDLPGIVISARLQVNHSKDETLANTPAPLGKDGHRD